MSPPLIDHAFLPAPGPSPSGPGWRRQAGGPVALAAVVAFIGLVGQALAACGSPPAAQTEAVSGGAGSSDAVPDMVLWCTNKGKTGGYVPRVVYKVQASAAELTSVEFYRQETGVGGGTGTSASGAAGATARDVANIVGRSDPARPVFTGSFNGSSTAAADVVVIELFPSTGKMSVAYRGEPRVDFACERWPQGNKTDAGANAPTGAAR